MVDWNIAAGGGGGQNKMADFGAMMARAQTAQINRMKMQEMERGLQEDDARRAMIAGGVDPLSDEYARRMELNKPGSGMQVYKTLREIRAEEDRSKLLKTQTEGAGLENKKRMFDHLQDELSQIDPASKESPGQWLRFRKLRAAITGEDINALPENITPELKAQYLANAASARKQMDDAQVASRPKVGMLNGVPFRQDSETGDVTTTNVTAAPPPSAANPAFSAPPSVTWQPVQLPPPDPNNAANPGALRTGASERLAARGGPYAAGEDAAFNSATPQPAKYPNRALPPGAPAQTNAMVNPVPAQVADPLAAMNPFQRAEYNAKSAEQAAKLGAIRGTELAKDAVKKEIAFPEARRMYTATVTDIDKQIRTVEALLQHEGLDSIAGLVASKTYNFSPKSRAAQSLFDTLKAKGGFTELQEMRKQSPTGGALGNVSNAEGDRLVASIGAIAQNQATKDLAANLTLYLSDLRTSKANLTSAFKETYKDAPVPGGGDSGEMDFNNIPKRKP